MLFYLLKQLHNGVFKLRLILKVVSTPAFHCSCNCLLYSLYAALLVYFNYHFSSLGNFLSPLQAFNYSTNKGFNLITLFGNILC